MALKFMAQRPLDPKLMTCPYCGAGSRIGVHSRTERRYKCYACRRTFAETHGTILYGLHYPIWVIMLVLSLISRGCPVVAVMAAFCLDERTVLYWVKKAGLHAKAVQEQVVCHGQVELGQVQADELCITTQLGKVWVATAMSVFSRLFLWGEVAQRRDSALILRLMAHVKEAASETTSAIVIAVDGFAAYPKAIRRTFYTKGHTGKPGRPRHFTWPNLHIVQVIKSRSGKTLKAITRTIVYGSLQTAYEMIHASQVGVGLINTAFIERLNATFRSRIPSFVRRTRSLARTEKRLEWEMFWSGVVYNFCTIHTTLQGTPAMAAGLTEEVWSVEELLWFNVPKT